MSRRMKNEPKFLSSISANAFASLEKKIRRDENDPCPIKTINHLLDPSLAVAKTNVSLRSLRSKPSKPCQSSSSSQSEDRFSNLQQIANASSKKNDESVNQMSTVCQNTIPKVSRNENIFAVPMMRAPRAVKHDSCLEEVRKAVLRASFILDEETFQKLMHILIIYTLNIVEKSRPGYSEEQDNFNDDLNRVIEWVQMFGSESSVENEKIPATYIAKGPMPNRYRHLNSTFNEETQFRYQPNSSMKFSHLPDNGPLRSNFLSRPNEGSIIGGSIFQPPSDPYGHQPNLSMKSHLPDNGFLRSSFMSRQNEGSITGGSIYPPRSDPYGHQPNLSMKSHLPDNGLLRSNFMSRHNAGSITGGSIYQPRSDPYGHQISFMQNNRTTMGYPSRALSRLSEFDAPYQPVGCSNCSTIGRQPNYYHMDQMPQMNGHSGNHSREYDESGRRAPSLVGGLRGMHFDSVEGNLLEQNSRGIDLGKSSHILAPLEPRVLLNRINSGDANFPVRNLGFYDSSQMPARSQREPSLERSNFNCGWRNTDRVSSVQHLHEMGHPLRSLNGLQDSSVLKRNFQRRMDDENCMIAGESQDRERLREERLTRLTSYPSVSSISSIRSTCPNPPQTPAARGNIMNQSVIVSVTRSGRAIRAPQTFFSTASTRNNCNTQTPARGNAMKNHILENVVTRSGRVVKRPQMYFSPATASKTENNDRQGIKRKRDFEQEKKKKIH